MFMMDRHHRNIDFRRKFPAKNRGHALTGKYTGCREYFRSVEKRTPWNGRFRMDGGKAREENPPGTDKSPIGNGGISCFHSPTPVES